MTDVSHTFSESWYRIAGQRIALRPHVQIRRQFFRGRKWFVVQDPFNNRFFRLEPAAYHFVARLHRRRTVQEVWDECLAADPDDAPGQQEVIQLLAQLFHANLLQSDQPADSARLFEEYRKRRRQETQARILGVMFAQIPLLDPDRFLRLSLPLVGFLIGPLGALLWLGVVVAGVKAVVEHSHELLSQAEGVLAPANLFLLYVGLVLVKSLHEFGHAFFCRKWGGEVHEMGVMLMIFTPIPYLDATTAWAFRERWKRVLVGAAGIICELMLAAIAAMVWAYTGPGTLHSLAYNMLFIASVSTVVFNGNPLLRYDGYYILSDLLDLPNLYTQSNLQWRYLVERWLFGCKQAKAPCYSRGEAWQVSIYGAVSWAYRLLVFGGILLFVASRFLLAGILMACVCGVSWVLVPLGRFVHYLATSPRLERVRLRAVAVVCVLAVTVGAPLGWLPRPVRFATPGVLESRSHCLVVNEAPGALTSIWLRPGQAVRAGQSLVTLSAPELDFEIQAAEAQLAHARAMHRQALQEDAASLRPIEQRLEVIGKRLQQLRVQRERAVVLAPQAGLWSAPELERQSGAWLPRGTSLGQVVESNACLFSAVIPQQQASRLFAERIAKAEVRLRGQAGTDLPVSKVEVLPADQRLLPSAALGWLAGGEVALDMSDPRGRTTREPFFVVQAEIASHPGAIQLLHGRSGRIRFEFGAEPLLQQWLRKLQQLIQKRYQRQ